MKKGSQHAIKLLLDLMAARKESDEEEGIKGK